MSATGYEYRDLRGRPSRVAVLRRGAAEAPLDVAFVLLADGEQEKEAVTCRERDRRARVRADAPGPTDSVASVLAARRRWSGRAKKKEADDEDAADLVRGWNRSGVNYRILGGEPS